MSVWEAGEGPLPKRTFKGIGRPTQRLRRDPRHASVPVKALALALPLRMWKAVTWREGTRRALRSRFAALRVRPANRDYWRSEPRPEEWLLIEWPSQEAEPSKYWLSTLPGLPSYPRWYESPSTAGSWNGSVRPPGTHWPRCRG
jgi:SRSO17 transposase